MTEDPITKIWAISFGIECMNINEAELFIFQDYDINAQRKSFDPHFQYQDVDKRGVEGPSSILQNTIDTTVYEYTTTHQEDVNNAKSKKSTPKDKKEGKDSSKKQSAKKKGKKNSKPKGNKTEEGQVDQSLVHEGTGVYGGTVKKERFNAINYAPRGSGELWKP